jgi:hypothetical protein
MRQVKLEEHHQQQLHLIFSGVGSSIWFLYESTQFTQRSFFFHSRFPITGKGLLIKQSTFQYLSNIHVHFFELLHGIVQSAAIFSAPVSLGCSSPCYFTLMFL